MAGPAYQWREWRFEPTECRLLRDGVVVPLPAKSLDLLSTLLRRAPRLITKEEILAAVWKDAAVEEGNIAFHIAALRKVLDEGRTESVIETVRGRGYRFVQDMVSAQMPATDDIRQFVPATPRAKAAPAPAPATTGVAPARRSMISVMVMAMLAGIIVGAGGFAWYRSQASRLPSIAVEPFEIVKPRPGQENLPDGLGTYLTSRLQMTGVEVTPRDRAAAVLSGQLHPIDNGFQVTVQLTRPGDNARLWDWSFDTSLDDGRPPAGAGPDDERSRIQGNIAGQVAEGVQRYLSLSGDVPVTR
jgi:DNA-binding winged helix-turn-helix (wHTH) protein/TolB-like protein